MAELINEFDAALVRLDPFFFDDFVDQVILAVSEAVRYWRATGDDDFFLRTGAEILRNSGK
jgi:hypothetical protein